jgi:hypothetical protein
MLDHGRGLGGRYVGDRVADAEFADGPEKEAMGRVKKMN